MKPPELKYPEFSASELTAFALELMRLQNYRVRRVNNVSVYKKRKNQVESGWSDLQGYSAPHYNPVAGISEIGGRIVLCEVKTVKDRLSRAQEERLQDCHNCGGIALICFQDGQNAELVEFVNYRGK